MTTEYIGKCLDLSSRTIKRNLKDVESYLKEYGYSLETNPGIGVYLDVTLKEKAKLKFLIGNAKLEKDYTKEERIFYIIVDLLKAKEPVKSYKYKSELNVSEGTISSDLDGVEEILKDYDLVLQRQQGVGVYVEGKEQNIRKLLVAIIYDIGYEEKVLEALGDVIEKNEETLSLIAEDKLLNMIDKEVIYHMEKVVNQFKKVENIGFTDSQYVALIVHLILVVERLRNGDKIEMDIDYFEKLKTKKEFQLGLILRDMVEKEFNINIPLEEVGYITMHLIGSSNYFDLDTKEDFLIDNFTLVKVVKKFLKNVSEILNIRLLNDEDIIVNLSIHLETAIKRMYMNMDIRNPLIYEIKSKYSEIYKAAESSVYILEDEFNIKVPEGEIGYIAMHIGATLEKLKRRRFNIAVVCPSGIGASRLLAMKVETEFSNIKVLDTISSIDIVKKDLDRYDFLLSTVNLSIDSNRYLKVNPLLKEEDREKLKKFMAKVPILKKGQEEKSLKKVLDDNLEYLLAINSILRNAFYKTDIEALIYSDLVEYIVNNIDLDQNRKFILKKDILEREKLGSIILEENNGILVHCRSEAIDELYFGFIKLDSAFYYNNLYIDKCILLLAPKLASSQWIETMSYLTQLVFQLKKFPNSQRDCLNILEGGLKGYYKEILDKSISKL